MAEAKQRSDWLRTSALMALLANAHRDPKKSRAFKPADFDPFAERTDETVKVGIGALKSVFIEGRNPQAGTQAKTQASTEAQA